MATVPLSGTNIRFLSDIPFSNDYKHTRWFDTKTEQTNYFMTKPVVHSMTEANFQRIEGQHFVRTNKTIDELWGTNYLMFQNAQYNTKWFYAFVTKLEYVQRHVTNVHFQIDVFQTWKFDMNFKPSFIVREHQHLWNADGTPYINTIDEGLDYGTEYETVYAKNYQPTGGYKWFVIVTKWPLHTGDKTIKPTINGTPQPLSYYIVPFKDNNTTPNYLVGETAEPISTPTWIMERLYASTEATNNIVSLYVTDYTGIPFNVISTDPGTPSIQLAGSGNVVKHVAIEDLVYALYVEKATDFEHYMILDSVDKYEGFTIPKESKLLMYPYTVTILDDFKGNRIELKNEYISHPNIDIIVKGSLGTSNKVSYSVLNYNNRYSGSPITLSNETALINNSPADVPIINDNLAAFLQGNKNSLQVQRNQAIFNGVMGGISGGVSGATTAGMINPAVGLASAGTSVVQGAGNTVFKLQAIEAKQRDISNIPPQIQKMGSNTAYDFGNGYNGVFVIKKQIKSEYRKKLEDFFNMYGYKRNEVKIPNFHTRRYWNYVQTESCVITGNFNNEDLVELKSVFDNGITLWHTDDVGNYALNNEVI